MTKSGKVVFGLCVLGVAALHLFFSFFIAFAAGLSPAGSVWKIVSQILIFPLDSIPALESLPEWTMWPMWGALSLSWGFAICWAVRRLARGK